MSALPFTGETTELLQALIRNGCVNDGTPDSGGERRNADLLATYLEGAGLDVERFTARSDRTSIVARIQGSDPDAPKLCLMGHTDVGPDIVDTIRVFDVYRGESLGAGKKSVAFLVLMQDTQRTLTDAEIDAAMGRLFDTLRDGFKATPR